MAPWPLLPLLIFYVLIPCLVMLGIGIIIGTVLGG